MTLYLGPEFDAKEGFKIENTLGDNIKVIEDDKIIKGGLKGDNEQI